MFIYHIISSTATIDRTVMGRQHLVTVTAAVEPMSDTESPSQVTISGEVGVPSEFLEAIRSGAESAFQQGSVMSES